MCIFLLKHINIIKKYYLCYFLIKNKKNNNKYNRCINLNIKKIYFFNNIIIIWMKKKDKY